MSNPARTEEQITTALLCLIRHAGNASAASRVLKNEKGINIHGGTLREWAEERYALRYQELREKYQEQIEQVLVAEQRENAQRAMQVQRLALEKANQVLLSNEDRDPGRTAANLSTVVDKNVRGLQLLQGRPTTITESRNIEEILRGLSKYGVLVTSTEDTGNDSSSSTPELPAPD